LPGQFLVQIVAPINEAPAQSGGVVDVNIMTYFMMAMFDDPAILAIALC
jgi:hypothetical protein